MAQFEYGEILDSLMTPDVVSALGNVREHRGRQELYKSLQPATLEKLCEVAKIQSTGASNRIENVSTSEVRLRELMQHRVGPRTRDEREIAGYRYVLDMMAACYADLDARVSLLSSGGKGEDILRAYFEGLVGTATKRRILDDNPTLSQRTVERVLQKLQAEGAIEKVGAARATAYRRVDR